MNLVRMNLVRMNLVRMNLVLMERLSVACRAGPRGWQHGCLRGTPAPGKVACILDGLPADHKWDGHGETGNAWCRQSM